MQKEVSERISPINNRGDEEKRLPDSGWPPCHMRACGRPVVDEEFRAAHRAFNAFTAV